MEENKESRSWVGRATGALAVLGTIAVGVGGVAHALIVADKNKWEAAGSGWIAAALAFGLLANALWRR